MFRQLERLSRFLPFFWRARTIRQVQAPFAYAFAQAVVEPAPLPFSETPLLRMRRNLRRNNEIIQVHDLGATANTPATRNRTVRELAQSAAGPLITHRRLARCAHFIGAQQILELGTSLGLSGAYLSAAGAQLVTLEGCPNLAERARTQFARMERERTEVITGPFRQTLPAVLNRISPPDLIYFDGDHRGTELEWQVETCLRTARPNTVFVLDDIYWSADMQEAWQRIRRRPEVRLSIDLFFTGFLFFREEILHKQHYDLVPAGWKPWQTGIRITHPKKP